MTPGDDLTVARRVYIRALESAIRLRLELLGALKTIERAERALKEGKREDVAKSVLGARVALSDLSRLGMQARLDGKVQGTEFGKRRVTDGDG